MAGLGDRVFAEELTLPRGREGGPNPYAAIQSVSCVRLFCDCVGSSPPASTVHRIFQHDMCPRKMGTCGHREAST